MEAAIEQFGRRLRETFEKGARNQKLARVGGNFSIVIHEKAVWTVITQGPRAGIHEAMTDDAMDFIMITTLDVFEKLYPLDGAQEHELDVESIIAANKMAMHGNIDVFLRFITMTGAEGMLALRAGAGSASSSSSSSKSSTKKRRTV